MLGGLKKVWTDCTQDANGRYVFKDVAKFSGFYTALGIFVASAVGSAYGVDIDTGGALIIIFASIGIQVGKGVENYFARKTQDSTGAPLATPESVIPPEDPELMPQNENEPAH